MVAWEISENIFGRWAEGGTGGLALPSTPRQRPESCSRSPDSGSEPDRTGGAGDRVEFRQTTTFSIRPVATDRVRLAERPKSRNLCEVVATAAGGGRLLALRFQADIPFLIPC